jgi:hypothetical protein
LFATRDQIEQHRVDDIDSAPLSVVCRCGHLRVRRMQSERAAARRPVNQPRPPGDHDGAIRILGAIAVDPNSTLSAELMATATRRRRNARASDPVTQAGEAEIVRFPRTIYFGRWFQYFHGRPGTAR